MGENRVKIVFDSSTRGAVRGVKNVASGLRNLTDQVFSLKGAIAGLGLGFFVQSMWEAGVQAQALDRSFKAITGSVEAAGREMDFVRRVCDELGLELLSTAKAYKSISAAAQDTSLEGVATRNIFVAISEAGAALGLTAEEVSGSLYALSQMISKGTVSSEELKQQLGERLPGALNLAAIAMGKPRAELLKMLEDGEVLATDLLPRLANVIHSKYGNAAREASQDANQSLNRFKTTLFDIRAEFAHSGFLEGVTEGLRDVAEAMKDEEFRRSVKEIGEGFGNLAVMASKGVEPLADLTSALVNLGREIDKIPEPILYALLYGGAAGGATLLATKSPVAAAWAAAGGAVVGAGAGLDQQRLEELQERFPELYGLSSGSGDVGYLDPRASDIYGAGGVQKPKPLFTEGIDGDGGDGGGGGGGGGGTTYTKAELKARERLLEKFYQAKAKATLTDTEFELHELDRQRTEFEAVVNDKAALDVWYSQERARIVNEGRIQRIEEAREEAAAARERIAYRKEVVDEIAAGIEEIKEKQKEAAEAEEQAWRDSREWFAGARNALVDYADEATNWASQIEGALTGAFRGAEDALVEFTMHGKASFNDFANSVLEDLVRIGYQQAILGPISSGMGNVFSGLFSVKHSGGMAEAIGATRALDPSIFIGAPRLHNGLAPDEFPAILQKGETVTPKGASASGTVVYVNVKNNTDASVDVQQRPNSSGGVDLAIVIDREVAGAIQRPGSATQRALAGTFGARTVTNRRA